MSSLLLIEMFLLISIFLQPIKSSCQSCRWKLATLAENEWCVVATDLCVCDLPISCPTSHLETKSEITKRLNAAHAEEMLRGHLKPHDYFHRD